MFKNYFKIAIRNILRDKGFSAINILGLAIGMASAIIILLWIRHQVSYDSFHEKRDRIYEAWNNASMNGEMWTFSNTPRILARTMEKDLPEVEQAVRVKRGHDKLLTVGEKKLSAPGYIVDSNFLQVFTFPFVNGNITNALNDVHSIVVTQTLAQKLFPNDNAMGKMVKLEDKDNFIISGILKDPPDNTRFEFEFLLPYSYARSKGDDDADWGNNSVNTYVLLKPNASVASLNEKMKTLKPRYFPAEPKWEMFVYPISRWRLYSNFKNGVEENKGLYVYVRMFGIIAAFILLIACINFMNLSTARSEKRAKEVGIRKVVGAQKISLVGQFIGESVFLSFIASFIAFIIVVVSLPFFNQLMKEEITFSLADPYTLLIGLGFVFFTGILAGSYPAFFLSSFQPVIVLKGAFKRTHALISPRKVLVVIQFTFAIFLIICTVIIRQQIDFVQKRDTGYNKNNLIYHLITGDIFKNYSLIREELLSSGAVTAVTKTMSPLTELWSNGHGQEWEGKDPNDKTIFNRYSQDGNLGVTAGIHIIKGRDLDLKKFPTDSTAMIINEAAAKVIKFKDPIGRTIKDMGVEWHIVGVMKDFIINSPYEPVEPMLVAGPKSFFGLNNILMRLNDKNTMSDNIEKISPIFRRYNPNFPFDYKFADEQYEIKFESEKTIGIIAGIFATLTIFIACLGLFGLSAYMTASRIKEIGVRKVLGDSIPGITSLLSRDFLKLVLISFLIAAPLAWWGMYNWLNDYNYRVSIHWWVFVLTGAVSMLIALVTVSSQTIKAAMANPVRSLRTD